MTGLLTFEGLDGLRRAQFYNQKDSGYESDEAVMAHPTPKPPKRVRFAAKPSYAPDGATLFAADLAYAVKKLKNMDFDVELRKLGRNPWDYEDMELGKNPNFFPSIKPGTYPKFYDSSALTELWKK